MIAQVTKLIRRHVSVLPQGELIVSLVPSASPQTPPTIELGLKGGKAVDRLRIDLQSAWIDHTLPKATLEPVEPQSSGSEEVREKDIPAFLNRLRTRVATAEHSSDRKENYHLIAMLDTLIADELRIYRGDAVHSD